MIVVDVSRISRLHSGDYGFLLIVETGIDLRGSSVKLLVRRPDGSKTEWNGIVLDKKPTQLRCYVSSVEVLQKGIWHYQSYVEKENEVLFGKRGVFKVF